MLVKNTITLSQRNCDATLRGQPWRPSPTLSYGIAPAVTGPEDFLDRRKLTHRAAEEDRYRWKMHLAPRFGAYRPGEVDAAGIRAFVEAKLAAGSRAGR